MKTALTIAGSDSSGGAGIQADIKTMCANGVFAMSAITALTAQNTCGVTDIMEASPQFLKEQLDCIFTDIRPDAVKIGMVVLRRADRNDRGQPEAAWRRAHRRRSGHGGHQRRAAHR